MVELDAFYMDLHEVTVGQFKQFIADSGYTYNWWVKYQVLATGFQNMTPLGPVALRIISGLNTFTCVVINKLLSQGFV